MSNYKDNKFVDQIEKVTLSIAKNSDILNWSKGEVTKPETINYKTYKPEKDKTHDLIHTIESLGCCDVFASRNIFLLYYRLRNTYCLISLYVMVFHNWIIITFYHCHIIMCIVSILFVIKYYSVLIWFIMFLIMFIGMFWNTM